MNSEGWRLVRLGDVAEVRHGFAFKGRFFSDSPTQFALFTRRNFAVGGGFRFDGQRYYDGPIDERFVLSPGDLMIALTDLSKEGDLLGFPARVPTGNGVRYLHNQRVGRVVITRPDEINDRYLYCLFRAPHYRRHVLSTASQTTVRDTAPSRLHAYEFLLPPVREQRRIAGVLGALDDKIERDLRLAVDLERLAALHFRHLFCVIEGAEPLGDHVQVAKGRSYKSGELIDSPTALVTLKSIRRGGGYSPGGLKPYAGDYKPEQVVNPGEIVVAQTDLTQAADVIGEPAIVSGRMPYETLVASLDLAIVRPRGDRISRLFVYHLLLSEPFQQHAYAYSNGSTVLHLSKEAIPSFAFEPPEPDRLAAFDRLAEPLFDLAEALENEAETLNAIRDALLPKLLSGGICVPDSYDPDDALGTVGEAAGAAVP
jgi:type I restriction enzyme, S subunit